VKPGKHSVALIIRDDEGRFLTVRRPDDPDDDLAGLWGFPAVTRQAGESELEAAHRVAEVKLGISAVVGEKIGESTLDKKSYVLHMTDYEARIAGGIPVVPQPDQSLSQYDDWQFTGNPAILREAARKGSLCVRIFLERYSASY
jgi:8-oxo-dGTP pyrophosphatase MutT (NUDIX family)